MKIQKQMIYLCLLLPCAAALCVDEEVVWWKVWSSRAGVQSPIEVSYSRLEPRSQINAGITFILEEDGSPVGQVSLSDRENKLLSVGIRFHSLSGRWGKEVRSASSRFSVGDPVRLRLMYSDGFLNVSIYDEGEQQWHVFYRPGAPTNGMGSLGIRTSASFTTSKYRVYLPCGPSLESGSVASCMGGDSALLLAVATALLTVFVSSSQTPLVLLQCSSRTRSRKEAQTPGGRETLNRPTMMEEEEEEHVYGELEFTETVPLISG